MEAEANNVTPIELYRLRRENRELHARVELLEEFMRSLAAEIGAFLAGLHDGHNR